MNYKDDWLTIITVSYNSERVLPRMLASVPEDVQVVIVDNASTDRTSIRQIAAGQSWTAIGRSLASSGTRRSGCSSGYTIVKDYMRQRERRGREMFVPLAHPPGHAQADFGETVVVIGGTDLRVAVGENVSELLT